MDEKFVNTFSESIVNILSTMAQMNVTPGAYSVKKNITAHGDITGLIGMAGNQARGTFAISFTEKVIFEITKRMLDEDVSVIDDTVIDMVGEITNMATGGAKKLLSEQGYRFDMAIPSVIAGKDHVIHHKSKVDIIIVPFTTEAGKFFIELCFEA